jgi:hypothetical protein
VLFVVEDVKARAAAGGAANLTLNQNCINTNFCQTASEYKA